jgi:5-methylcytosine-specific restriction endonuclease McrA
MRRVSKARLKQHREYLDWKLDLMQRRFRCEARVEDYCTGYASDLHHILSRSQGGALMEEDNVMVVCRWCHEWIERHPNEAKDLGFKRSPWKGAFPNEH